MIAIMYGPRLSSHEGARDLRRSLRGPTMQAYVLLSASRMDVCCTVYQAIKETTCRHVKWTNFGHNSRTTVLSVDDRTGCTRFSVQSRLDVRRRGLQYPCYWCPLRVHRRCAGVSYMAHRATDVTIRCFSEFVEKCNYRRKMYIKVRDP